jgi:hypothetical protein
MSSPPRSAPSSSATDRPKLAGSDPTAFGGETMAWIAAANLVAPLQRAGFVVMKEPPARMSVAATCAARTGLANRSNRQELRRAGHGFIGAQLGKALRNVEIGANVGATRAGSSRFQSRWEYSDVIDQMGWAALRHLGLRQRLVGPYHARYQRRRGHPDPSRTGAR